MLPVQPVLLAAPACTLVPAPMNAHAAQHTPLAITNPVLAHALSSHLVCSNVLLTEAPKADGDERCFTVKASGEGRVACGSSPGHFSKQQQQQQKLVWCVQARIVLPTWASGHYMHVSGPSHSLQVSDFGLSRTLSSAGCKPDSFGTVRCVEQIGGGPACAFQRHAVGSSPQAGTVKHAGVRTPPCQRAGPCVPSLAAGAARWLRSM